VGAPGLIQFDAIQRDLDAYMELRQEWRDDPGLYLRMRLGMKPTWQQNKIIDAIQPEGAKVSVRSGHGTGKTGCTAGLVLWFLETRDYCKIPCTAPTGHQLRDVLWAELAKWLRASDTLSAKRGDHPAFWLGNVFRYTQDRIYDPSARGEWFAVARTSSKDNPDALQGFHASDVEITDDGRGLVHHNQAGNIMFVVDEAAGVADQVFEVAEGALSSQGARLLMLANPTRTTGYFADSHRKDRGDFTTVHLKSGESPLVDPAYRVKLVRKWGENSNVVRVRADGEFPKQDDDVLISIEWAEAAIERERQREQATADIRLGIDVARFGSDRTVYTVRQGANLLHAEIHAKEDTMQTSGRAVAMRQLFNATGIYVDVIGVGAGVADRLKELEQPVIEVNVAESAPFRQTGKDEAQGKTLRDYLWLVMADWLHCDEPSFEGVDADIAQDLAGELASVKYKHDSSGRIVVESKDEMKKRLGFSPDIADSLGCTFHPGTAGPNYAFAGERVF
jgi:hypothetical protein